MFKSFTYNSVVLYVITHHRPNIQSKFITVRPYKIVHRPLRKHQCGVSVSEAIVQSSASILSHFACIEQVHFIYIFCMKRPSILVLTFLCKVLLEFVKYLFFILSSAPLSIGLTIAVCHLLAIPYTGCGLNPARSLGPALVTSHWKDHWIYWAGPFAGSLVAALMYKVV